MKSRLFFSLVITIPLIIMAGAFSYSYSQPNAPSIVEIIPAYAGAEIFLKISWMDNSYVGNGCQSTFEIQIDRGGAKGVRGKSNKTNKL